MFYPLGSEEAYSMSKGQDTTEAPHQGKCPHFEALDLKSLLSAFTLLSACILLEPYVGDGTTPWRCH